MEIKNNLFDLTSEQEEMSKMIYNGKVIKCLVAPYHSYAQLEKTIPFTKTTYLFPEREISVAQLIKLVSIISNTPSNEEFRIITTNQNIIMDMIDGCVRVLTEGGNVVSSPCKTFAANIHDIRHSLLENKDHQLSESERNKSVNYINEMISAIRSKNKFTKQEYDCLATKIDMIGEPIIRNKMKEMLADQRYDF
jgi:hypothetical protein